MTAEEPDRRTIVQPSYLSRFSCIGSACEDNCCSAGWNIAVDQHTFQGYQELQHELGPKLREVVIPNPPTRASAADFAHIELDAAGVCPFHTDDRLCRIQGTLGAGALSDVCLTYPRRTANLEGRIERAATLSCPEVARLALLDPDAMEPSWIEEPSSTRLVVTAVMQTEGLPRNDVRQHLGVLREGCATILRAQDVSIETRLIVLGMLLGRLDRRRRMSSAEMSRLGRTYLDSLGALEGEMRELRPGTVLALELLREIAVERFTWRAIRSARYSRSLDRALGALRLDLGSPPTAETLKIHDEADRLVYRPFIAHNPHLWQNYVLNEVAGNTFPYGPWGPTEAFALLVMRFVLLRALLIGTAAAEGRLSGELVVEVVQPFERLMRHELGFTRHLLDVLRRSNCISLAFWTAVLASSPAERTESPQPIERAQTHLEVQHLMRASTIEGHRRAGSLATSDSATLLVGLRSAPALAASDDAAAAPIAERVASALGQARRGLQLAQQYRALAEGFGQAAGELRQLGASMPDPPGPSAEDVATAFSNGTEELDRQVTTLAETSRSLEATALALGASSPNQTSDPGSNEANAIGLSLGGIDDRARTIDGLIEALETHAAALSEQYASLTAILQSSHPAVREARLPVSEPRRR